MKLKNYTIEEGNHFIAIEYYALILNRTFLILITDKHLIGLKVNGIVSVETNYGHPITRAITNSLAITENLENPFSYMKNNYLNKLTDKDIFSDEILKVSSCNFKLNINDIVKIFYDKSKKWGMGPYPHNGKIYIQLKNNKKKEFIIIGQQSGENIVKWIKNYEQQKI